jgi:hypothetical protein
MKASGVVQALQEAIAEHGDMDFVVLAGDGWYYDTCQTVDKIYCDAGRRNEKKEEKGTFNTLTLSLS